MWAEVRVSWITLYLLTLSAAAQEFERLTAATAEPIHLLDAITGIKIGYPLLFMCCTHWLYANACVKGEEVRQYHQVSTCEFSKCCHEEVILDRNEPVQCSPVHFGARRSRLRGTFSTKSGVGCSAGGTLLACHCCTRGTRSCF